MVDFDLEFLKNAKDYTKELQVAERRLSRMQTQYLELKSLEEEFVELGHNTYRIKEDIARKSNEIYMHGLKILEMETMQEEMSDKQREARLAEIRAAREEGKVDARNLEGRKKAYDLTKNFLSTKIGIKEEQESILALVLQTKGGLKAMVEGAKSMLTPFSIGEAILGRVMASTIEVIKLYDQAFANFNRTTGLLDVEADMLDDTVQDLRGFGLGITAAGKAAATLHGTFAGFSSSLPGVRTEMTVMAAKFDRIGISSAVFGQSMDILNKSLGYSIQQSMKIAEEMENFGRSIGVTSKRMMEDFTKGMKVLDMYGKKGVSVFQGLAKEAKRLGVQIDELTKMEMEFTTFENAAKAAGQLNAMAGRAVIDPMKLMMAEGEEKQKILQAGLKRLGLDFNNPRDILAAAQALGVSVGTVRKMLNADSVEPVSKSAKDYNEVVKLSATLQEKWNSLLRQFAVAAKPILEFLQLIVEGLQAFMSIGDGVMGQIFLIGGAALVSLRYVGMLGRGVFGFFS